ncbi:hypothetical protein D1B31_13950 [Neobacillus notoginsengisoli]|uniref:Uncharacterized protein n=1 Tax=Neobacillus notoginsengisoli TaxID=1578198 RepID=A0A417YSX6_9BACI|nr:hypothetical protein [Neobacillus notoginsengisoli]RHW39060.1 hypothetical protein D1B31_13950 [Neobacillus notoginsengisoli]
MPWETLPSWFWIMYYLFLLVTLAAGIVNVFRNRLAVLSVFAIALTITIPIIGLINSIGREDGMNEFEHLVAQLQLGSLWAIYVAMGLFYLLIYWAVLLKKKKTR